MPAFDNEEFGDHRFGVAATNISTAFEEWDNGGITFHPESNAYKLVYALLSEADRIDGDLNDIYHAHHIESATDDVLDQFAAPFGMQRKSGEADDKYRARIKSQYRVGNIGTTHDDFVEFAISLLGTEAITVAANLAANPATATVSADPEVYNSVDLTNAEVKSFLERALPAGHEIAVLEKGTLRLKTDGDTDDLEMGLTSDSIETGGTLSADV